MSFIYTQHELLLKIKIGYRYIAYYYFYENGTSKCRQTRK